MILESEHGYDHEQEQEQAGESIRQPQHRIVQGALPVAGLVVVPVVDLEIAFQF